MEKIRCVNINTGDVGFFVPSLANGKTQDSKSWQEATGWRPEPVPGDLNIEEEKLRSGTNAGSGDTISGDSGTNTGGTDTILGHREMGLGYDPLLRDGQVANPPADIELDLSQTDPNETQFPLEINNDEIPLESSEESSSSQEITPAETGKGTGKAKPAQGLKPKTAATAGNKKRTAGARKN